MVRKAYEWVQQHGFDFIITGEVMGQRPMSQRKDTMPVVQYESGAGDLLLRPLCAKHLPPTLPEREGWVDRDKLFGFSGRSRKPQMALAKHYGFTDYATPAGGCCFLTNKAYSEKLVDMWQHRPSRDYQLDDIMLLNPLIGLTHHESLAIKAGVHVLAITMPGIEQYVLIILDDIHNMQLDTQLFRHPQGVVTLGLLAILFTNRVGVAFNAKTSEKINSFHMDTLLHDGAGGQHRIQAPGNKGHRFSLR